MRSNNRRWVAVVVDGTGSNTEEENEYDDEEDGGETEEDKGVGSEAKVKSKPDCGWDGS